MAITESQNACTREEFDVCIVGAGPHALAALSALSTPRAKLSDSQCQRSSQTRYELPSVCVVDPAGSWLYDWKKNFETLGIDYLRSPVSAHPDAHDESALLEFAFSRNRSQELYEPDYTSTCLKGLPELTAGLFQLPGAQLFADFCDHLADSLPHQFIKGKVDRIKRVSEVNGRTVGCGAPKYDIRVACTDKTAAKDMSGSHDSGIDNNDNFNDQTYRSIGAKHIVLALGDGSEVNMPESLREFRDTKDIHGEHLIVHSREYTEAPSAEDQTISDSQEEHTVLVIGGGLSAAQAALAAIRKQSGRSGSKVILCSRKELLTRRFDLSLSWLDRRHAQKHMYDFYGIPYEGRGDWIREVRGGGSIPPEYMSRLLTAERQGRLVLMVDTVDQVKHVMDNGMSGFEVRFTSQANKENISSEPLRIKRVILGTGCKPDCMGVPLVRALLKRFKHKLPITKLPYRLPILNEDLQWGDEQITVVGALASLSLGPDGGNLMGASRAGKLLASQLGVFSHLYTTDNVLSNSFSLLDSI